MRLRFLFIACCTLCLSICLLHSCSDNHSSVSNRPYVILVSMDGFRSEYATRGLTPWLDSIASIGKRSVMRPSFPTLTFPNHYTLATGLTPAHHGIIHNSFYATDFDQKYEVGDSISTNNPAYYGGEPIWITAEKQGVKTACIYWVSNQIAHDGILASYNKTWDEKPHIEEYARIDTLAHLLSLPTNKRPHLLMLYYDQPDHTGHQNGPESQEMDSLLRRLDSFMGHLYQTVQTHPLKDSIQIIITSDHGMQAMDTARTIHPNDYLKPEWIKYRLGIIPAMLYAQEGCVDSIYNALKDVEHLQVWKKEDVPARYEFGDNNRIGDVIVLPDLGYQFCQIPHYTAGAHGFDPFSTEMHVPVWTLGSCFSTGQSANTQDSLVNVDIYPLICDMLKIKPAPNDGQSSRWQALLKQ